MVLLGLNEALVLGTLATPILAAPVQDPEHRREQPEELAEVEEAVMEDQWPLNHHRPLLGMEIFLNLKQDMTVRLMHLRVKTPLMLAAPIAITTAISAYLLGMVHLDLISRNGSPDAVTYAGMTQLSLQQ